MKELMGVVVLYIFDEMEFRRSRGQPRLIREREFRDVECARRTRDRRR